MGILQNHLLPGKFIAPQAKVVDFVKENSCWNWLKLESYFLRSILDHISACYPLSETFSDDVYTWKLNMNGKFSMKTAYGSVVRNENLMEDNRWKLIWDNSLTSRIKHFLWLVRRGRLLTNSKHARRRMTDNEGCSRCETVQESISHVLHNCKLAAAVWMLQGNIIVDHRFFLDENGGLVASEFKGTKLDGSK